MGTEKKKYTTRDYQVADYMRSNPTARRAQIINEFGKRWRGVSERTIDRVIATARKINEEREEKKESAVVEKIKEEAVEDVLSGIALKKEALGILREIMLGRSARMAGDKLIIPSDSDRVRAIGMISEILQWNKEVQENDLPKIFNQPLIFK